MNLALMSCIGKGRIFWHPSPIEKMAEDPKLLSISFIIAHSCSARMFMNMNFRKTFYWYGVVQNVCLNILYNYWTGSFIFFNRTFASSGLLYSFMICSMALAIDSNWCSIANPFFILISLVSYCYSPISSSILSKLPYGLPLMTSSMLKNGPS